MAQTDVPATFNPSTRTLTLVEGRGEYALGPYLDILDDPSRQLTINDINDVASQKWNDQFVPSGQHLPRIGYTDSAIWVRCQVLNPTIEPGEWMLELRWRPRGCMLHFVIQDTGIGIEAERQQAIFEPFTQADGSSTRQHGGAGLGLTLSKRFVEVMGGRMLESELGKGSTVHFTVPLTPVQNSDLDVEPLDDIELRGPSVLVVDDNETNRRVLVAMLRQWDMAVTSYDGARKTLDALERCASGPLPNLVLLDSRMPEMDGFGLAQEIKSRFGSSIPVVLLTSAQGGGDVARCMELGIQAYLSKPIRQSELREAISRVVMQATPTGDPA
jgi:CheY-like chemotaxis protein